MTVQFGSVATETRARNISLAGLGLQVVLAACLILVYQTSRSAAALAAAWFYLGGVLIWIPLILIHQLRGQVAAEALETERLKEDRQRAGAGSIFELDQEEFLVAQRRLTWMYRWVLPGFVLSIVAYLLLADYQPAWRVGLGVRDPKWRPVDHASLSIWFVAGIAFVAFLFSRYVSGMARETDNRLLRSGAVYLFGNAMIGLLLAACLALVAIRFPLPEHILAVVIRYLSILLALEFLINFVLDFYRPRLPGIAYRPAFESRLIGLISEPGDIAKSIADAVNYQFGFEVSTTWFYKMIERAVIPLAALSIVILVLMSSVVLVDAGEQAVIERFGRRRTQEPLTAGLVFKLPWPIDRVRKADVGQVRTMVIGDVHDGGKDPPADDGDRVLTWTTEHRDIPYVEVLVATALGEDRQGAVPVNILWVSMPVQYRVKSDPEGFADYLYRYDDPELMLRELAYRQLVMEAVNFDYEGIMGAKRAETSAQLHRGIQEKCDQLGLGIELVSVGLEDVHPPTEGDVAKKFQELAMAEQEMNLLEQKALIDKIRQLSAVSADPQLAESIYRMGQQMDQLAGQDGPARQALDQQIREALDDVGGAAGQRLQEARATAVREVAQAAAKANTFKLELSAFEAAPRLYKMRKVLNTLSGELDNVRKYVVMYDRDQTQLIIELRETENEGLQIIDPPAGSP